MAWEDHGSETPFELYVVVNIPKGSPEKMTANLIGPILINIRNSQAVQLVLADSPYSHRFPLLKQN
jgi:flagellar assembly factor FliW